MRLFAVLGTCLALFLSACGSLSAPAGSYIHAGSDIVAMLQIADVRDGQVDATLSVVALEADGKLSAGARPVAGTLRDGVLQLVSDTRGVRTLISGVIDGGAAELTVFSGGTSQTLVFEKQSARSFTELSSKLQSSAVARVQAKAEAESESEHLRVADRRLLQAQIDKLSDTLSTQVVEVADGALRLRGTSREHIAAESQIARLGAIAKGIKPGTYEADAKLQMIESDIEYLKEGRRQANFRAQRFFERALGMVSVMANVAELERHCLADQQLDCRKLGTAAAKLREAVNGLEPLKVDEQAAYIRIEPSQSVKKISDA
jgi:hypothetical protein